MEWYNNLYIGPRAAERIDEVREDIEQEEFEIPELYLITLASNGIDQLDLIAAGRLLGKKAAVRRIPMLVGVAVSRSEALDLLQQIAADTFHETGGGDIRSYLVSQHRDASFGSGCV